MVIHSYQIIWDTPHSTTQILTGPQATYWNIGADRGRYWQKYAANTCKSEYTRPFFAARSMSQTWLTKINHEDREIYEQTLSTGRAQWLLGLGMCWEAYILRSVYRRLSQMLKKSRLELGGTTCSARCSHCLFMNGIEIYGAFQLQLGPIAALMATSFQAVASGYDKLPTSTCRRRLLISIWVTTTVVPCDTTASCMPRSVHHTPAPF